MLTLYRPKKWVIPAMASRNDLLLLKQIHSYQPKDEKIARKHKRLLNDFHQTNYMATIGALIGLLLTAFLIYLFWDDLISKAENTLLTAIVIASCFAVVPFCYYIRILGMWLVKRNFQKLEPSKIP